MIKVKKMIPQAARKMAAIREEKQRCNPEPLVKRGPYTKFATKRRFSVGANLVFAPTVLGEHQVRPYDLTPFDCELAANELEAWIDSNLIL
jgi:hypothetical protein